MLVVDSNGLTGLPDGDTGNDKDLEGRCPSSGVCSLRPGSPWLAYAKNSTVY